MVDADGDGLVDHVLDGRGVPDREQLLGHRSGRRQEAGAEPGGRNDEGAHLHRCDVIFDAAMPTYIYKFVETDETIEIQQSFSDATLTEAVHPGTGRTMAVKKVFTPVGVTFKGGGFYKTDSRGKSPGSSSSSTSSSTSSSSGTSSGASGTSTSSSTDTSSSSSSTSASAD